jgi:hypothetical protein
MYAQPYARARCYGSSVYKYSTYRRGPIPASQARTRTKPTDENNIESSQRQALPFGKHKKVLRRLQCLELPPNHTVHTLL